MIKKIAETQTGQSSRHLDCKTDPDTVKFVITFGYIWASKAESDRLLFQATTVKHTRARRRGNCLHWGIYLTSKKEKSIQIIWSFLALLFQDLFSYIYLLFKFGILANSLLTLMGKDISCHKSHCQGLKQGSILLGVFSRMCFHVSTAQGSCIFFHVL